MSFLAPLFFVALAGLAVPVFVHLIQRERKDIVEFPSLMFIRRIPYQSVERRRIHNWPLLLLRLAAMALVVAAFSRPFFTTEAATAAITSDGARDVVILLDRSASMAYGDHWARAQEEARTIVRGLSGDDRATFVLFDRGVEENVRATSSAGELELAINQASVSAEATRYAPALREAQSLLSRSDRQRREAFLISDFQRSGWERQEEIQLPEGATITPISVVRGAAPNLTVSSVAIQRATFSGEERATVTAALVNRSDRAVSNQQVTLEIDGRQMAARQVSIGPHDTGSVTFDPLTVAEANIRGVIRAGSDALAADNNFFFVLSPSRTISVLLLQADGAASSSQHIALGLSLSKAPPFRAEVVPASRFMPANLEGRAVVVMNDVALSTAAADQVARFVQQGGGLFVVLGGRTPAAGDWPVLPGTLGAPVDRTGFRGGTFGTPDYSHRIFEQFKDPRSGSFADMRFYRYRRLAVGPDDRVLARFDDGAAAFVERRLGSGRVLAFTSTLDGDWNDFPKRPMFLPVLHEAVKYLAQYGDVEEWHTVGRMLDISSAVASIVREGQATRLAASETSGVVVSPGGQQTTLGARGAAAIELAEQGFYSVRLPGTGDRRPYSVAVNIDPAESDLGTLDPAEFIAGAVGAGGTTAAGQPFEQSAPTPVDLEKRQSLWWFLLVAGLAMLLAEAILSNRQSRRPGVGLPSPTA
jgi:hypothetical protein